MSHGSCARLVRRSADGNCSALFRTESRALWCSAAHSLGALWCLALSTARALERLALSGTRSLRRSASSCRTLVAPSLGRSDPPALVVRVCVSACMHCHVCVVVSVGVVWTGSHGCVPVCWCVGSCLRRDVLLPLADSFRRVAESFNGPCLRGSSGARRSALGELLRWVRSTSSCDGSGPPAAAIGR